MSESWTPNETELGQMVAMLEALRDPSRPNHREAVAALDTYILNPSFVMNLLHVFVHGSGYTSIDIRQLAGFVMKNYVLPHLHAMAPEVLYAIKAQSIEALKDSSREIKNTASIIFGRYSELFAIDAWADVLGLILQMLDLSSHGQSSWLDGALLAIKAICEDSQDKLCDDPVGRPLDRLVPQLIILLDCTEPSIRLRAMESLNSLLFLLSVSEDKGEGEGEGEGEDGEAFQNRQRLSINRHLGKQILTAHMPSFLQVHNIRTLFA